MRLEYILQSSLDYTKKFCFENKLSYLILLMLIISMGIVEIIYILGNIGLFFSDEWIIWLSTAILFAITFLIYGYLIRVCRDGTVVSGFNNLGEIFIDGIKSLIIYLCWIIPFILCLILAVSIPAFTEYNIAGIAIAVILGLTGVFLSVYLLFYSAMGIVRFSKTGKFREGLNYSALKKIIRTNGWIMYIISMIILGVVYFIAYIAVIFLFILNIVAGIIIASILLPPFMVFCARYLGAIYEEGEQENFSQEYFLE